MLKRLDMVIHAYNFSYGEVETDRSMRAHCLSQTSSRLMGNLALNKQTRGMVPKDQHRTVLSDEYIYVHTRIHLPPTHTHIYLHSHTCRNRDRQTGRQKDRQSEEEKQAEWWVLQGELRRDRQGQA